VPKVRKLLKSDDPWLVGLAVNALATQDLATREAVTVDILKLATRTMSRDRRRIAQRAVAAFLFARPRGGQKGVFADSLDYDGDRKLLVAAFGSILANEDGRTRGLLKGIVGKVKDGEQLATYLPAIVEATRKSAPSGIMFADEIRMAGLDLLSRMRIREGMQFCVDQLDPDRWGQDRRIPRCLASLKRYGGNARELLPQLRETRRQIDRRRGNPDTKRKLLAAFDDVIKTIETGKTPPKLRTAREVIRGGK
jgi:hypothetical protein